MSSSQRQKKDRLEACEELVGHQCEGGGGRERRDDVSLNRGTIDSQQGPPSLQPQWNDFCWNLKACGNKFLPRASRKECFHANNLIPAHETRSKETSQAYWLLTCRTLRQQIWVFQAVKLVETCFGNKRNLMEEGSNINSLSLSEPNCSKMEATYGGYIYHIDKTLPYWVEVMNIRIFDPSS